MNNTIDPIFEQIIKGNFANFEENFKKHLSNLYVGENALKDITNWQKFFLGFTKFQQHTYQRELSEPQTIWQEGSARMLQYKHCDNVPVVLFVPSLINKSYILDLSRSKSMLRYLAKERLNINLLDWGEPCEEELDFGFDDYVHNRLCHAINHLYSLYNKKIILVGYCLGGILAIHSATLLNDKIERIALLATPWDFTQLNFKFQHPSLANILVQFDKVPAASIKNLFYLQDFPRVFNKFITFSELDPKCSQAKNFVAVERWVSDGISVSKKLMQEIYQKHIADSGAWSIDPTKCKLPCLVVIPTNDRIAPPASTIALAKALPNRQVIKIEAGHVGMIIGSGAKLHLWFVLKKWLLLRRT